MLYRKKPVIIEAITFEEFVEHGKKQDIVATKEYGYPWCFDYKGHAITSENENSYIIPTLEGNLFLTENDMLITGVNGEIYPCKKEIFEKTYELVQENN